MRTIMGSEAAERIDARSAKAAKLAALTLCAIAAGLLIASLFHANAARANVKASLTTSLAMAAR